MAKKNQTALEQGAAELEALVKSHEPPKTTEETVVEQLEKSASAETETVKDDEGEDEKEDMAQSQAAPVGEELKKSLAENESYQQVVDVAEPLGILGDAMVKGFSGLEKSQRAADHRIERLEQKLGLMMKAQAIILKALDERSSVRTPMTGHFGTMAKSQGTKTDGEPSAYTEKQLKRAALVLLEEGKLPSGSGAYMNARGAEQLFKSLTVENQKLFSEVIEREAISA